VRGTPNTTLLALPWTRLGPSFACSWQVAAAAGSISGNLGQLEALGSSQLTQASLDSQVEASFRSMSQSWKEAQGALKGAGL
jgi:hypothetical protein